MRLGTLVGVLGAAAAAGCGAQSARVGLSTAGERPDSSAEPSAAPVPSWSAAKAAATPDAAKRDAAPSAAPPPDPALLGAVVDKTGASDEHDNSLHLRMEVLAQPLGEPWVAAVVNRGTEPVKVQF